MWVGIGRQACHKGARVLQVAFRLDQAFSAHKEGASFVRTHVTPGSQEAPESHQKPNANRTVHRAEEAKQDGRRSDTPPFQGADLGAT